MSTHRTIPPLLNPYLSLPSEQALILLTSVLGASTNWLILRSIVGILMGGGKVVLVSFLRDGRFWGEGGRKLGLDLEKLTQESKFLFIDGLSELFLPTQPTKTPSPPQKPRLILNNPIINKIQNEILSGIRSLGGEKTVLIIDGLDALLAACGEGMAVGDVEDMVMGLREEVHSTIMAVSADDPLINSQQTPLEMNHAALVLGMAHQADFIMSLRLLDTGTARDVSGVVRITLGEEAVVDEKQLEEKELLYFVGGDGAVKVFERGQ